MPPSRRFLALSGVRSGQRGSEGGTRYMYEVGEVPEVSTCVMDHGRGARRVGSARASKLKQTWCLLRPFSPDSILACTSYLKLTIRLYLCRGSALIKNMALKGQTGQSPRGDPLTKTVIESAESRFRHSAEGRGTNTHPPSDPGPRLGAVTLRPPYALVVTVHLSPVPRRPSTIAE